jgi:1-acyl-sn-glycerol-3-phosphate acyltransferase
MNILLSLFYWFIIIPAIELIMFPISLITWIFTVLFDKRLKLLMFFANVWGSSFVWLNPFLKVEIKGKEKIDPNKTYVITPNHSSLMDIPSVHGLFIHFKWISKASLKKVPFIGWNMALNKTIFVSRTDPKSQFKMMHACEDNLDIGNSIMIFPEGTRYEGRELGRFRDGAFMLAKKKKVDILPIAIINTDKAYQGLIFKHKVTIKLEVLDPIAHDSYSKTRELRDAVKKSIEEKIALM